MVEIIKSNFRCYFLNDKDKNFILHFVIANNNFFKFFIKLFSFFYSNSLTIILFIFVSPIFPRKQKLY